MLLLLLESQKVCAARPMWWEWGGRGTASPALAREHGGHVVRQPSGGRFCLKRIPFQSGSSSLLETRMVKFIKNHSQPRCDERGLDFLLF